MATRRVLADATAPNLIAPATFSEMLLVLAAAHVCGCHGRPGFDVPFPLRLCASPFLPGLLIAKYVCVVCVLMCVCVCVSVCVCVLVCVCVCAHKNVSTSLYSVPNFSTVRHFRYLTAWPSASNPEVCAYLISVWPALHGHVRDYHISQATRRHSMSVKILRSIAKERSAVVRAAFWVNPPPAGMHALLSKLYLCVLLYVVV
jgi:hypothetical protein